LFTSKLSVGLDVGSHSIKLVGLRRQGGSASLKSFGMIPTPEGYVENGLINDPEEVGRELGKLVESLKLKGSSTISALSGQQVYTRLLSLPTMRLSEMRTAAMYQASSFMPISIDDVTADIYPVRKYDDPTQGKMTEVFFVAARKSQAENLLRTCRIAGLKLDRIEIEPLAVHTLYRSQLPGDKIYGIINIGAQRSYISIFQNQTLVFIRTIAFGCSAFFQQIPSLCEGEVKLEQMSADDPEIQRLLRSLLDELGRSLDYYRLQNKDDTLGEMLLCGGCSRLNGIDEVLGRDLNVPVKLGTIDHLIKFPAGASEEHKNDLRYDYPVALGLALRGGA